MAYAVMVLVGIGWNLLQVKGLPVLYAPLQPRSAVADAAAAAAMTVAATEMEMQYVHPEPAVFVVYSIGELRAKVLSLLIGLRWPEFQCAADVSCA